jgi:mannose-6-phosphate isomerase-like protein (cupin superfamily)
MDVKNQITEIDTSTIDGYARKNPGRSVRIDASSRDLSALNGLVRQGVRPGNENVEDDLHLKQLITKPWGCEYRIYADDFLDVWNLLIDPGHGTSLHAHPRKVTYLLCLAGEGITSTLTGEIPVRPGSVLRIGRGAFHATRSTGTDDPLALVEVETPRNKLDLMRLRDSYERAGTAYETTHEPLPTAVRGSVTFLPNAHLCERSPRGDHIFEVRAGMDVYYRRRREDVFYVPLGVAGLVADDLDIITQDPEDERVPEVDRYYLVLSNSH